MPPFVDLPVEGWGETAVRLRRDNRLDPPANQCVAQPVRIEGTVSEKPAAVQPFDQPGGAAQILRLPRQQPEVDQVAERIGSGEDLRRQPTGGTPDGLALSPPFAPCPWR